LVFGVAAFVAGVDESVSVELDEESGWNGRAYWVKLRVSAVVVAGADAPGFADEVGECVVAVCGFEGAAPSFEGLVEGGVAEGFDVSEVVDGEGALEHSSSWVMSM
jgi:hypothetical protein